MPGKYSLCKFTNFQIFHGNGASCDWYYLIYSKIYLKDLYMVNHTQVHCISEKSNLLYGQFLVGSICYLTYYINHLILGLIAYMVNFLWTKPWTIYPICSVLASLIWSDWLHGQFSLDKTADHISDTQCNLGEAITTTQGPWLGRCSVVR